MGLHLAECFGIDELAILNWDLYLFSGLIILYSNLLSKPVISR